MRKKRHRGVKPSPSGKSILYDFYLNDGTRRREVVDVAPSAENLRIHQKRFETLVQALALEAAGIAAFDYAQFFPHSKWLKRQQKTSTTDTVGTTLWSWFAGQTFKPTVARQFRGYIRAFEARWGDVPLTKFEVGMVRAWIKEEQNKQITVKTIRNKLVPLRGALDQAVEEEKIPFNPVRRIIKIKTPEWETIRRVMSKEIDPFTPEELEKLYAACLASAHLQRPQLANLIKFTAWTGMRLGEVFALCWEDIDFDRGIVKVYKSRTERRIGTPKTLGSIREVELIAPAKAALLAQKAHTFLREPQPCGQFGPMQFVFYNEFTDAPWMSTLQLWTAFKPLCRRAGVRYRYAYQLRHTFATLAISAGENEKWIAKQMGHGTTDNPDTTMLRKNYGRWYPSIAVQAGMSPGSMLRQFAEKLHGT